MTTSELELEHAPTREPLLTELANWQLYKEHCMCRSFDFSSQGQAFRFVGELSALTLQHEHKVGLRAREDRVFLELEVAEDQITAEQLDFIRSVDALKDALT